MSLANKVALVSGAGSGIGRAIAEAFAGAGARVIVHDLAPEAQSVADALGGTFLKADLADRAAVRRLAEQALQVAGRVDILVNNAGFQHIAPIEEFPEEVWQRMLQVLLTAPFQLTKHLLPAMKNRGWGHALYRGVRRNGLDFALRLAAWNLHRARDLLLAHRALNPAAAASSA